MRLNDREYAALERNRGRCNLPQQSYLRFLAANVVPREAPQADFVECIQQLRRIGNNLNQLAVKANKYEGLRSEEYRRNNRDLWDVINHLVGTIVHPEYTEMDVIEELIKKHTEEVDQHENGATQD